MDSYRIGQHIVMLDKQTGRLHLAADGSAVQLSAQEVQALLHWLEEQRALLHSRGCWNCGQHASTFCQYCERPLCSACRGDRGFCTDCRGLRARETLALSPPPSPPHDDLQAARAAVDELYRQRLSHYLQVGKELIERKNRLGVLEFHKSLVSSAEYSYAFACLIMQLTKRFPDSAEAVSNLSREDLREIRAVLWYLESLDHEQILREAKGIAAFEAMYDQH